MLIEEGLLDFVSQALVVVLKISAPVLGAGILVGLLISIFQSVTSIQEQTLALVPKIFIMTVMTVLLLPWIVRMIANYSVAMFTLV